MPFTFLFIIGAMFLVPVCFVGGIIFFFNRLSLRDKKRDQDSTKKMGTGMKIFLSLFYSVLAAIAVPICFLLLGLVLALLDSMFVWDYWRYNGSLDNYRMPLEPPYELVMVDAIDYATIKIWQEDSSSKINGIIHYEKRENLMFGIKSDEYFPGDRTEYSMSWFIFDLSNGDKVIFTSEEKLTAALRKRDIEDINLKTVKQNWNEYW